MDSIGNQQSLGYHNARSDWLHARLGGGLRQGWTAQELAMEDEKLLPEYDFSGGNRGKHYEAYRRGHTTVGHQSDGTTIT